MISKVLIANRGEVVGRIARTAHRLGLSTVGVYSDLDANALHVDQVDVAVALGGETPADSYLRGDAIIAAARQTGADAIHPGYGFLAESADFAQAVIDAGLTWVGSQPRQIRLLGNKVSAKAAAVEAGVPTAPITEVIPGRAPAGLTMPVLVKAAAGGGGRGMRIVRQHIEISDAIAGAAREAEAAFGDGTVFIEPYIERGRHIEVQIIGDGFGTVLHLGSRECSIQRRNQKIIEEAPAVGISDELREQLIEGALALARHIGYEGAGTVEFMVGEDETVNFLEVNTRLQVEHAVTEAITGRDLVELQLLVADGKRLPIRQHDITFSGHAIEARIVAEDPANDWLPSTGTLARFAIGADVRVDSGVRSGSVVSSSYDSMLAKVVSHASTRREAAVLLARALRTATIAGVQTNVDAVVAIMDHAEYQRGETFTSYLVDHADVVGASTLSSAEDLALVVGATFALERTATATNATTGFAPSGWRNLRTQGQRRTWRYRGSDVQVEYTMCGDAARVLVGPWPVPDVDGALTADERPEHDVRLLSRNVGDDAFVLGIEVDGVRSNVEVIVGDGLHVSSPAGQGTFALAPLFVEPDSPSLGGGPISPLPGTVIAVHASPGDDVVEGQLLMVVEAMKMEHKIIAPSASTVGAVLVGVGDRVDTGQLLVELGDPEAATIDSSGSE